MQQLLLSKFDCCHRSSNTLFPDLVCLINCLELSDLQINLSVSLKNEINNCVLKLALKFLLKVDLSHLVSFLISCLFNPFCRKKYVMHFFRLRHNYEINFLLILIPRFEEKDTWCELFSSSHI